MGFVQEVTAGLESDYGAAPNFAPKNTSLLELFSKRDAVRLVRIKKRYDPDNMFSRHNLKF
jgi:FAD/FMN-containing dehydrogenase